MDISTIDVSITQPYDISKIIFKLRLLNLQIA